jgi:hypothetical protein
MEKFVRKYSLNDPAQELDDKEFWKNQSYEYKVEMLERLRLIWAKMNPEWQEHGDLQGFRRVFAVTKRA